MEGGRTLTAGRRKAAPFGFSASMGVFLFFVFLIARVSLGSEATGALASIPSASLRRAEGSTHSAAGSHRAMFEEDENVKEILFSPQLKTLLEEVHAKAGPPLVLMIYSGWCPYCLLYSRTFSSVAAGLSKFFRFAAFNCAESRELSEVCAALRVRGVPNVKLVVPQSLHDSLALSPAEAQQKLSAAATTGVRDKVSSPLREDGGVLDGLLPLSSFGLPTSNPPFPLASAKSSTPPRFYVYTLDMPGSDLRSPLRFAAEHGGVELQERDLSVVAFERFQHLNADTVHACSATRWAADEAAKAASKAQSLGGVVAANSAKGRSLARHRLHDAISGLVYLLTTWVPSVGVDASEAPLGPVSSSSGGEKLSAASEEALIRLLEVVRELVPLQAVKKAAAEAILFVHAKRARVAAPVSSTSLLMQLEQRRLPSTNKGGAGSLSVADWRSFVAKLNFGEEHPALAPLQEPKLVVCETITCSMWMLFHFLAESATVQAREVFASEQCKRVGIRILETRQPLPVSFVDRFSVRQTRRQQEAIALAALTKKELIERHPHLGCGFLSARDVAVTIRETVARFFGCVACQKHFAKNFHLGLYGLAEITAPGSESPSASASTSQASTGFLLQELHKVDALRLWLWRVHNAVSVRVAAHQTLNFWAGDARAKDFVNCDARWPPVESCLLCRKRETTTPAASLLTSEWLSLAAKEDGVGIQPSSEDFDERRVLAFLHEQYWPPEFPACSS